MINQFAYCFFKYTHSLRLGESLNVGLLLFFPFDNKVIFRYPNDLQRLKCTYNDFEESQLKIYLSSFEKKVNKLSYDLYGPPDIEKVDEHFASIIKEILPEDVGVLQFSEIRKGVKYSADVNQISDDLFVSYFQHYYDKEQLSKSKSSGDLFRRDEHYIMNKLQELMIRQKPILSALPLTGKEITTTNAHMRFDLQWTNHAVHLIKPLSLDYRSSGAIEEKAHSLHSKLHIIELESNDVGYKFDILVSKPQLTKLLVSYQRAISIIREASKNTAVIEEEDLVDYSKTVAEALTT